MVVGAGGLAAVWFASATTNAIAQPWDFADKIVASDPTEDAEFGGAVAVDGDRLVAGSYRADGVVGKTGAAYVFERDGLGDWVFQTKLTSNDSNAFEWFGESVDIDGDRVIVGAPFHNGMQDSSGGAFIFERDGNGDWSQVARLIAPDGEQDDFFAMSVAIDGDVAIVGCPQDSNVGFWSGSVYVFERDGGGVWNSTAHLFASDETDWEYFGTSVAVDGGRFVVGTPEDQGGAYASGAAYVFERDGGGDWNEVKKFVPDPVSESSRFGEAVGISVGRVIVGAPNDDTQATNAGAAYVFIRKPNGDWVPESKLTADDGAFNDQFGISVSVDGDRAAAGAYWDGDLGSNSGSAYMYESDAPGSWSQVQKITAFDGAGGDWFGNSVALSDEVCVVGSPNDDDNVDRSGSAYVYERASDSPVLTATGDCPGDVQILLTGATPLQMVGFIASYNEGELTLNGPPCPGITLDLRLPFVLGTPRLYRANANGVISIFFPANLCGLHVQAVDLESCGKSNTVTIE